MVVVQRCTLLDAGQLNFLQHSHPTPLSLFKEDPPLLTVVPFHVEAEGAGHNTFRSREETDLLRNASFSL